jgi:hypothetical protein
MSNRKYRRAVTLAMKREERRIMREQVNRGVAEAVANGALDHLKHPRGLNSLERVERFLQGLLEKLEGALPEQFDAVIAKIGISICRALLAVVRLSVSGATEATPALVARAEKLEQQVSAAAPSG